MRYEDLLINPEPILGELFCFLLDVHSIEGTVVEKRIKEVSKSDFKSKSVYSLKTTEKNLNKNKHMYSDELMKEIGEILKDHNIYCGYSNLD